MTYPETSDNVTLTYTVQPASGKSYFKIDLVTGELRVTDRKGLVSGSVESVQVGVTLSTNITFLNQAAAPSMLIEPSIEIE